MSLSLAKSAAGLALALTASLSSAQTILKVHHFLPSGAYAHQSMILPWCAKIEKESAGDLKCQIYPAMQLGGTPPQLMDQVRDGVADIVWAVPTYTAGRYIKSESFELPFMATTARQGAQALWDYVQTYAMDEYQGIQPIFMHITEGYLLHSNQPIKTMADLKGKKIRTATRISARMMSSLGGTPVQMPLPQVPDALSKGVVDGVLVPWEALPATKLHEIVKYHTDTERAAPRVANTIFMFGMNKKKYDSLTPAQKRVIDSNSGREASKWAGGVFDDSINFTRKLAVDRGNNITTLSSEEFAAWQKASEGVERAWLKDVGPNGPQLITAARALLAKYAEAR